MTARPPAVRAAVAACAGLWLVAADATAQVPDTLAGRFAVFTGSGQPTSLDAVADAVRPGGVLFLGEQHDDAVAHALELRLLDAVAARHPVVLALEMFETDVQTVLDEFLGGLVAERDFLGAARPWGTYATDYRPLVERARERGWPVVASNAPARYVRLVTRDGLGALDRLAPAARLLLPPVVAPPSDSLAARFTRLMAQMSAAHGGHGGGPTPEALLVGQNLRDATMAWRMGDALAAHPDAVVVHVNGSFHSAERQGVPEHLARLAPGAPIVTVTVQPSADLAAAPAPGADDFVVLTAAP